MLIILLNALFLRWRFPLLPCISVKFGRLHDIQDHEYRSGG